MQNESTRLHKIVNTIATEESLHDSTHDPTSYHH